VVKWPFRRISDMNTAIPRGPKTRIGTRGLVRIWVFVILTITGLCLLTVHKQHRIDELEQVVAQREKHAAELITHLKLKPSLMLVVAEDAPSPGMAGAPLELQHIFNEMGGKYQVEPALLAAVAKAESGFNSSALSPKGAMGMMQLTPVTLRHLKLEHGLSIDPWDPRSAVEGAAAYLQELQSRFNGPQVLAAYNLGPTRLRRLQGDFSGIQETEAYVAKISRTLGGPLSSEGLQR